MTGPKRALRQDEVVHMEQTWCLRRLKTDERSRDAVAKILKQMV